MSGRVRGPSRARTAESGVAPWWRIADLGVFGLLVTAGSALLVPTYGNAGPVLATAVGAAVAVLALTVADRFRLPGALAGLGIAVGVVVVGSLLVSSTRSFGALPSVSGMSVVLRGSVSGWRELLTVATPTGVAGALLVPPLIIGAVATTAAGWIALSRRPALALVGPAVATVMFALLGSRSVAPATTALVAGLLVTAGMSWIVWIGSRARRRAIARAADGYPAGNAAGTAAAVTRQAIAVRRAAISIVVLAVAVLAGSFAAAAAAPSRVALREVVELPVNPTDIASPLSLFRTFTKDQADVTQLFATGLPAGARLRLAALDSYDGRQFTVSDGAGPFVRIGRERDVPTTGVPTTVTVEMRNYAGSFLPLPGPIITLDFEGERAAQLTEDLRYSEAAATGLMPGGWQVGDTYTVLAAVPSPPTPAELDAATPSAVPFPTTIALPDLLRSAADSYIDGATGAAAQVEAIRAGLAAAGEFSHGIAEDAEDEQGAGTSAAGHGLDRMAAMVTEAQMVGDQEQYATLMALMVRSIGLPARVAVGFVQPVDATDGTGQSSSADDIVFRGRDISAWVEVPFDGYGWVAFDPSPSPDNSEPNEPERSLPERRAVTVEVPPALPQAEPDSVDAEDADQRPDVAQPDSPAPESDSALMTVLLTILGWLVLLLAVLAVPVVAILGVKAARRRRRRRAEQPKDQITGGWAELLDTAVDAGYRPAIWNTRTETAADLKSSGVLTVDWLAPAADAAEFSPGPVSADRANGYWREVDDRSAELLAGLPLWRRWRARLSLASMRRADRRER